MCLLEIPSQWDFHVKKNIQFLYSVCIFYLKKDFVKSKFRRVWPLFHTGCEWLCGISYHPHRDKLNAEYHWNGAVDFHTLKSLGFPRFQRQRISSSSLLKTCILTVLWICQWFVSRFWLLFHLCLSFRVF